jgi:ABC-type multidrug transport system ATPase subunit
VKKKGLLKKEVTKKVLLHDVNGNAQPGRLFAIMGGSGKSKHCITLLM